MSHALQRIVRIAARALVALVGIFALTAAVDAATTQPRKSIRIGFGMSLTGGLAPGGRAALIAMEIWRADVNAKGGLLGRPVEFIYYDDAGQPAKVPGIYTKLIDIDKVDFVVSGYGTNVIAPAMPIVMRRKMVFPALFGLAANDAFRYERYFQIMPAGPEPGMDWSKGFFELALEQNPRPRTVAIIAADAEFALNAAAGARENARKGGFEIVYDRTYPPSTTDFTPIVRAVQATHPDIVYVASYPPDSVGMVKAANEVGLKAKLFGGGMVGLQFAAIQKNLGPMLNDIVNYDFWVPEPVLSFPGVHEFLAKYQAAARDTGADPLGHYLPPYAYAYLQVLGQAVEATRSLDHGVLAAYMRTTTFDTIVGKVQFGRNGEWARSRTLMVQFRDIQPDNLDQFARPAKRVVLYPREWKSGEIVYPYKR